MLERHLNAISKEVSLGLSSDFLKFNQDDIHEFNIDGQTIKV